MRRFLTIITAALVLLAITIPALADNEGVCPVFDTGHLSAGDATSLEIFAPEGKLIVGYCVKAGSINQGDGPEVWFTSGVESLVISHSSGKQISHYSVQYADKPLIEMQVEVAGYCIVDQDGTGLAYADFVHPLFATFTLNGTLVEGDHTGVNAQFGENTWSAEAKAGYVLIGDTSGSFFIEECGNPGTTTTTSPGVSLPVDIPVEVEPGAVEELPTVIIPPVVVAATPTTAAVTSDTLPFTGPEDIALYGLVGLAAAGLGTLLVASARRREDEPVEFGDRLDSYHR